MAWFIALAIGIALTVIAYMIMPKPKAPKPPEAKDMESPTAEAGRPLPVVFGSLTVKGLNCLWFGEKSKREYEVNA